MTFYGYVKGVAVVPVLLAWLCIALARAVRAVYRKATATANRE